MHSQAYVLSTGLMLIHTLCTLMNSSPFAPFSTYCTGNFIPQWLSLYSIPCPFEVPAALCLIPHVTLPLLLFHPLFLTLPPPPLYSSSPSSLPFTLLPSLLPPPSSLLPSLFSLLSSLSSLPPPPFSLFLPPLTTNSPSSHPPEVHSAS